MDAFRRQRSAGSDRFLGLFPSPPPVDSSFPPSSSAPAGGVELHEAEVLWTSTADGNDPTPRSPASATSSCGSVISPSDRVAALRRPRDRNFGILAALAEDGAASAVPPLVQRKPSIASPSSPMLNSPPRSSSSGTGATRMIPAVPKSKLEYSISMPVGRIYQAQSLPLNVPVVPRRAKMFEREATEGPDDGDGQEMMPPHEIVARNYGSGLPMTTFSMLEGAGRTLKGRDLWRVRDAVFRQTGFQD